MRRVPFICMVALLIAGCDSKPTTIVSHDDSDDMRAALAKAKPVVLPPSIVASKTYRCDDNQVAAVDWFSDGSAALRMGGSAPTRIPAMGGAGPSGYSLKGDGKADAISVSTPGHLSQKCSTT